MERKRNDRGRFTDRIPPERVLEVFEEREDPARPLTARDIADALGCSRRAAHAKLRELADRGEIETRKVGANARVWWIPIQDTSPAGGGAAAEDDPLFDLPTFSGEDPADVSTDVDEHVAAAIAGESEANDHDG